MHVEVRGKNKIPYLYESYRKDGKVYNKYIGKLADVLQRIKEEGGTMPEINISKYGQTADISVSLANWNKQVLKQIRIAEAEVNDERRDKAKQIRNESIYMAKAMAKAKIPYRRIAHELSIMNKRAIGKGTAYRWANSAKITPEFYDPSNDIKRGEMEKRLEDERWEEEYQTEREAWAERT